MPESAIRIVPRAARTILHDARARVPDEACGLLGGDGTTIQCALPIANIATDKRSSFALQPAEQLRALKQLDAGNLVWMGVYHCHPRSAAIPSPADIAASSDPKLLQLIVSLQPSQAELRLWRIDGAGVAPLELIFAPSSPCHSESLGRAGADWQMPYAQPESARTERATIITAALISLMLVLAISLTLLPPAPSITP